MLRCWPLLLCLFLFGCAGNQYQRQDKEIDAMFADWNGKLNLTGHTENGGRSTPFGHSGLYHGAAIKSVSIDSTYGRCPSKPIKVRAVADKDDRAERLYLETLLDKDGHPLIYERLGLTCSYSCPSSPDNHGGIDVFEITTRYGKDTLFIDVNRKGPLMAPTGYTYSIAAKADFGVALLTYLPSLFYQWDGNAYTWALELIDAKIDTPRDDYIYAQTLLWFYTQHDPRNNFTFPDKAIPKALLDSNHIFIAKYYAYFVEYTIRVYPNKVDSEKLIPLIRAKIEAQARGKDASGFIPYNAAIVPLDASPSRLYEMGDQRFDK